MRQVWLVLLVALAPPAPAGAREGRRFTLDDLMRVRTISATAASPDGALVAYGVQHYDLARDEQRQSIWVVGADGGAPRRLVEVASVEPLVPVWSPDGRRVAYRLARDGHYEVWAVGLAGEPPARLVDADGVSQFAWSPDGARVAYTASSDAPARSKLVVEGAGGAESLYVLDVASRRVTAIDGTPGATDLAWSPDGAKVAYSAAGDIFVVAPGAAPARVVDRQGPDVGPRWSPDGSRLAFFSGGGARPTRMGLSLVAAAGGPVTDLARDFDGWMGRYPSQFYEWTPGGRSILFSTIWHMTQRLNLLSVGTGRVAPFSAGDRVLYGASASASRAVLAFVVTDPTTPGDVYVTPVSEYRPTRLTRTNPELDGVELGASEAVHWRSPDGLEVEGLLVKPVDYDPKRRYPLVVIMEGTFGTFDLSFSSRVSADGLFFSPYQHQLLAARGYAVLLPNPRGSWGYGEEFGNKGVTDFAVGPCDDFVAGVDMLVERGVADPNRIGVMALAVDAYRAAFALTRTTRFRAASLTAGFYEPASWYGQVWPTSFQDKLFGGPPWERPEQYDRLSPLRHAGSYKTPTLIVGMNNPAWTAVQAEALATVCRRNGVPSELLVYNGTEAWVVEPTVLADLVRRNVEWFDRWLVAPSPT